MEYRFSELFTWTSGKPIALSDGPVPVYGSNGIIGFTDKASYSNRIILGRVGAYCGSVAYCPSEFNATDNTLITTCDTTKIQYRYAYYMLKQFNLNEYAGGAAQPLITQGLLKHLKCNVPSLDKQQTIIDCLTAYDNLIEVNNKRIKVLEQMAENLYKEWFVRFRFPGHETAEFENGLPKGWQTKPLNEWLCECFNGGWGEEDETSKTPIEAAVIRGTDIEDVKNSRFADVPLRYHKCNDVETKKLLENDIILELSNGNINNIGRTLFVTQEVLSHFDNVICASFCKTLRFADRRVAFYIWQFIEYLQKSGLMFYYKNTGANGINNFNFKRFLKMMISVPPMDNKGLVVLMSLHNEISVLREKNYNLIKQRDLLLPRLMSGKMGCIFKEK